MLIAARDNDHAGQARLFRLSYTNTFDVEIALADQTGNAGQHPRLIVHQY
jgi:hypothetical protein